MSARISLARFFVGLSKFLESVPVLVMKPMHIAERFELRFFQFED